MSEILPIYFIFIYGLSSITNLKVSSIDPVFLVINTELVSLVINSSAERIKFASARGWGVCTLERAWINVFRFWFFIIWL